VAVEGVKRGIELCVRLSLGKELADVSVAIQGVGQLGGRLADALSAAGARLVVCDLDAERAKEVALRTGARVVSPGAIFEVPADVFAPCALGSAINSRTLPLLKAPIVAGGANNQIANDVIRDAMHERGLIYAPDMVINGGRVIASAAEIRAFAAGGAYDHAWIEARLAALMVTLESILRRAHGERRPAADVAIEIAKSRIVEAKQEAA
jgi:leucine dehydrogenase